MKVCSACRETKPLSGFTKVKKNSDGHSGQCAPCTRVYARTYTAKNPARIAAAKRKYNYGISREHYASLFAEQGGKCAICRLVRPLCVEHDHASGKIRGLTCRPCNTALSFIGESEETAQNLAAYIRRHKAA